MFSHAARGALYLGKHASIPIVGFGAATVVTVATVSVGGDTTSSQCEASASKPQPPPKVTLTSRRMTQVGRFSLLSETVNNPSIPCMILALSGDPMTKEDFLRIYHERGIATRHERLESRLNANRTHFVREHHHDDDDSSRDKIYKSSNGSTVSTAYPKSILESSPVEDGKEPVLQDVDCYPSIYRSEVKEWVEDAVTKPLDLESSLWQIQIATDGKIGQSGVIPQSTLSSPFVSGTTPTESLVMIRAHHCMADGVSLGALLADLVDEAPQFQVKLNKALKQYRKKRRKLPWWKRLAIAFRFFGVGSVRVLLHHIRLWLDSLKMALFRQNPWTYLKRIYLEQHDNLHPGPRRVFSWCQVTSVQEVKEVARYFSKLTNTNVTINEVFASCVTAAISRLLQHHREREALLNPKGGKQLPTLKNMNLVIPVHMQGGILLPGQGLSNKIGALVCRVPAESVKGDIGDECQDRLLQVHKELHGRKSTPGAFIGFMTAKIFGGLHQSTNRFTAWIFSKSHASASAVLTNVRGPEQYIHIDGRRVESTIGFIPLPPNIPIGVVCQSYAGQIGLTVTAEPWAMYDEDADLFLSWIVEEYDNLRQRSKMNISVQ